MSRREQFVADLSELLSKYHAEINAADFWQGYAECGQDIQMEVTFDAINGPDGEYASAQ